MSLTAPFPMKVGDTEPPLSEQLTETATGAPIAPSLGMASSVVLAVRPSGVPTALLATYATILDPTQCTVEYNWGPLDTAATGPMGASQPVNYYQYEWQVTYQNGARRTWPDDSYKALVLYAEV